ncbi:MAG: helix-turn-helix domain-containing protein [Paracoccus denitrificans]|uniref:Helix-turn-helix domain-containing protein n=1 Tax=Paracoccus denitrificans TaxID=266 RepID=A0A533I2T0_PARDE|nr:MAG: helix-turn-helix domain-containing protein [Paracoccus denitrificans]
MLTLTHQRASTIGEITAQILGRARGDSRRRGGLHITKQPVHGGSKEAGSFHEEAFFGRLTKASRRAIERGGDMMFEIGKRALRDARRTGRELTAFERKCVRITGSTLRVLATMLYMDKLFKGRVYPSYEMIADWAIVSRATVHRALKALEAAGLLARLRRYVQTEDETIGARSEQTSNAYRLELPAVVRDLIERRFRPAPMPDDEAQRQRDRLSDHAAMLSSLPKADYIRATTGDAELAKVLVRLWEGIEKRGSL